MTMNVDSLTLAIFKLREVSPDARVTKVCAAVDGVVFHTDTEVYYKWYMATDTIKVGSIHDWKKRG